MDLPFADLLHSLGRAIAESQVDLDRGSLQSLGLLANEYVDIVPEITETIEPAPAMTLPPAIGGAAVPSGVRIAASGATPVRVSLLDAGFLPTFYQFVEASVEVKLEMSFQFSSSMVGHAGARLQASPVDFRTSNTYSFTADRASVLRATFSPVPAPSPSVGGGTVQSS